MARYIFVTGGVVSSLGKGLSSASLAYLLKSQGFKVRVRKMDPYLNVDPGTMSEDIREKISKTKKSKGYKLTEEHKKKFTRKGKKNTVEHINKFVQSCRRRYTVTYEDGRVEEIVGLLRFCEERGYTKQGLHNLRVGKQEKYKDIVSFTRID